MDDARFEDLPPWRKAMDLAVLVHRVSGEPEFVQETILREEAVKTAITIPSRVAEGLRRQQPGVFGVLLDDARGKVARLETVLYIALEIGCLARERFDEVYAPAEETGRLIDEVDEELSDRHGGKRVRRRGDAAG
jgi:four helix bundle protein